MLLIYTSILVLFFLKTSISTITSLSSYVSIEKHYLLPIISGDDQHIPHYTGCKPTDLAFDLCNPTEPIQIDLPESLKSCGNNQIKSIIKQHQGPRIKFIELWPSLGGYGFYTWVYARALTSEAQWTWFNSSSIILESAVNSPLNSSEYPEPYFPQLLETFSLICYSIQI